MKTIRNKLNQLINKKKKKFTIKEIIHHFKEDGLFAILFIITFPTSIPSPSYSLGSSTILGGLITIFLSFQILLGKRKPYLPDFIMDKKINVSTFRKLYHKRVNYALFKMEKYFKKSHPEFFNKLFTKFASILMILNGIWMIIPIIFTNWLPSTTITFISFSYLFRDGFMFIISMLFAIFIFLFYKFAFKYIFAYIKKYKDKIFNFFKKDEDKKDDLLK